jgi:hypothetical protein
MHGKPRPARYLSELTDIQATVLQRMHTQIVYVEAHGDATKEHHIAKVTITGLVGRGLIEQRRDKRLRMLWKTTEAGARLDRDRGAHGS